MKRLFCDACKQEIPGNTVPTPALYGSLDLCPRCQARLGRMNILDLVLQELRKEVQEEKTA